MKTLLSITQKLIQLNLFAAFVAVLVFVAIREQQAIMTDQVQKSLENPRAYHQSLKQSNQPESTITAQKNSERIQVYEQKLQKLTKELQSYQIQQPTLLSAQNTTPSRPSASFLRVNPSSKILTSKTNRVITSSVTSLVANPNPYRVILRESPTPQVIEAPRTLPVLSPQPEPIVTESTMETGKTETSVVSPQAKPIVTESTPIKPVVRTIDLSNQVNPPQIVSLESIVLDYQTVFFPWLKPKNKDDSNFPLLASQKEAISNPRAENRPPEVIVPPSDSQPVDMIAAELEAEAELVAVAPPEQGIKEVEKTQKQDAPQEVAIRYANDIAYGLIIADERGEINYGTRNYKKVQTAINRLRRGETLEEAARVSQLSPEVLKQLGKWGERRPGRDELTQISQSTDEYE